MNNLSEIDKLAILKEFILKIPYEIGDFNRVAGTINVSGQGYAFDMTMKGDSLYSCRIESTRPL